MFDSGLKSNLAGNFIYKVSQCFKNANKISLTSVVVLHKHRTLSVSKITLIIINIERYFVCK